MSWVKVAVLACALSAGVASAAALTPAPARAAASPGPGAAAARFRLGSAARAAVDLDGVSCTSSAACTAVGSTPAGTVAERWDGQRWALEPAPDEPGGTLSGVSCPSKAACVAVGGYDQPAFSSEEIPLAESWRGTRWVAQPVPYPADRTDAEFSGVACPADRDCLAVGNVVYDSGAEYALSELWNGKKWMIVPTPAPAHADGTSLNSISCTSPAACTAVGSYDTLNAGGTLAERWNGNKWTIQATPSPAGAIGLYGVSCAAAACTAVGDGDGSNFYNFAMHWNGQKWTEQAVASPAQALDTELPGISCSAAETCIAVGDYETSSWATLAERWNGQRWVIVPTPNAARPETGSNLAAVSCPSATACLAVGNSDNGKSLQPDRPLAEGWDGKHWVIQHPVSPPAGPVPASAWLYGVSCTSATSCTAAGDVGLSSAAAQGPLAERWNGKRWAVESAPNPVFGGGGSVLSAVSCFSGRACTTVGERGNVNVSTLAERWDGKRWVAQSTPSPAGGESTLAGVACVSAASCFAVGSSINSDAEAQTLGERWNGSAWVTQRTPNPPAQPGAGNQLDAVACTSPNACTAVGLQLNGPLAERWDGTKWSVQATPSPQDPGPGELLAVSCPSPVACLAVGDTDQTGVHRTRTLAERWNGRKWTRQDSPDPAHGYYSFLTGISCSQPATCIAVGFYAVPKGNRYTLAERWNGTKWAILPTPNPPPGGDQLNGLSCPSATACIAVGESSAGPFAERWNGTKWALMAYPSGS
jgi:hypothetical protein